MIWFGLVNFVFVSCFGCCLIWFWLLVVVCFDWLFCCVLCGLILFVLRAWLVWVIAILVIEVLFVSVCYILVWFKLFVCLRMSGCLIVGDWLFCWWFVCLFDICYVLYVCVFWFGFVWWMLGVILVVWCGCCLVAWLLIGGFK